MSRSSSRLAILEAARAEFGEHGFAGARVSRIAKRSGLNKQLIYYYFGSKAELHRVATSEAQTPAPATAASPSTPAPESIRTALAGLLDALERRPDVVALLVDRHPPPDARAQARAWVAHALSDLAAAVSDGQGMGYFRDDVDPAAVARQALVSCVGFLAVRRHLEADTTTWLRDVSETLLRASRW